MTKKKTKRSEAGKSGSALIMTVVLTVMLAIVAVMFVAVARMDMASTGNIADNKALESSAKFVIEIINRQLVLDTPGVAGQEYYDYPDASNAWLASIEPYPDPNAPNDPNKCKWRQISDITGYLKNKGFPVQDVNIKPVGLSTIDVVREYPDISVNLNGSLLEQSADADGDGIADSKWFELANMRSSKGKPIYAAVRIIDNSGMVNINTAYRFDANSTDVNKIDGKSLLQINLNGLLKGSDDINDLYKARCKGIFKSWDDYEKGSIWRYYGVPDGNYLPFDISDELELRYRYCIDSKFLCRLERGTNPILLATMKGYGAANSGYLYNTDSSWGIEDWQNRIIEPNRVDRRHLLTALNLDRIIDPDGQKMTNINTADVNDIYNLFTRIGFDANTSAQIAVNIIDYRDSDSNVTDFNVGTTHYYGFERPCVYISELAYRRDPMIPSNVAYAIELCNPYGDQIDSGNGWKLTNGAWTVNPINWSGTGTFYFIVEGLGFFPGNQSATITFSAGQKISLTRTVNVGGTPTDIVVDSIDVPGWLVADSTHSLQRDITPAKCIRRLWDSNDRVPTLGAVNDYNTNADTKFIQAHPADSNFTNIGEIGMILRKGAYYKLNGDSNGIIGYDSSADTESKVRLNLADPNFQKIFKYLTVLDPNNFYPNDPNYAGETRVKGRININTAPAYVLSQLPWVSLRRNNYNDPNLAKAIIAYRDKSGSDPNCNYSSRPDPCGFRSIGELCNVVSGNDDFRMDYYSRGSMVGDQNGFPDLDPNDGVADDFEERDLIFARISNLVTVRSDVFTAYILVRIGTDGPQKRCITILDRSRVKDVNDRAYIRAFQTTPEAR